MQVRWVRAVARSLFQFFLFVRGEIIQSLNHNTMEEIINKATELLQPINYEPHEIGYYVVMNGNDRQGSDYCETCIKEQVKIDRNYHRTMRKQIIERHQKFLKDGFYYNRKKKVAVTAEQVKSSMRYKLKEFPAKATFTYEGHDPDFGGGLSEPCCCAECGEPFQCSFTPDKDEADRLLDYISDGTISERTKWEIDIAFYHFKYCDDDVKEVLVQVANSIIKSLEGGQKKEKFEKENVA